MRDFPSNPNMRQEGSGLRWGWRGPKEEFSEFLGMKREESKLKSQPPESPGGLGRYRWRGPSHSLTQ